MPVPRQFIVVLLCASLALASVGCAGLLGAEPSPLVPADSSQSTRGSAVSPQAVVAPTPEPPAVARARVLLAAPAVRQENWDSEIRTIDVDAAPDGLKDLVLLRRAEAGMKRGDMEAARAELRRPEMRDSTNRLILEQAGKLADRAGDSALAGDLYGRGAGYFGWTAERVRMYLAAGAAYKAAGMAARAAEQYQTVLENYSWTKAADLAGGELASADALTPYHRGILAISQGEMDKGLSYLSVAAKGGPYASAALTRLYSTDDAIAWARAVDDGTVGAYQEYVASHAHGAHVADARFREGLIYYEDGYFSRALAIWDDAEPSVTGDAQARAMLWAAKALEKLGDNGQAVERLKAAAASKPAGYYAVRARDLLAGHDEWMKSRGISGTASADERNGVEKWIAEWAGQSSPDPGLELRVKRGMGLAALGLAPEAEAELNAVVASSEDPRFLFRLASALAEGELWTPASRAAGKVATLSPAKTAVDVPSGLQRLIYPVAYGPLVVQESDQRGIDPVLLLSLVFQESRYDQFAISYADARGLTQVMPATGKGTASALGFPDFAADDLYRPDVALRFGAVYLAEQLKNFDGDPFRALAAYNAGPGSLKRWSTPDPDLFVERIDYSQTRDYVRQIYLHYSIYRSLSDSQ